jgi:hypothetical protein
MEHRRSTDKKNIAAHMRDNAIQWATLLIVLWAAFGSPIKNIGIWAFNAGRGYEKLKTDFYAHCASDSVFRIDIIQRVDAAGK